MNKDENFIHKYYALYHNEDVSSGSENYSAKRRVCSNKNIIFDVLLNKSKIF